ncbi:tyrosine-protein phosphatase [soil metagenome]
MIQSIAPARSLDLAGATNFRDLGGYTGHGGRSLRWRRLFRSDHLGALTAEDLQVLGELKVLRVCDFRGVHERTSAACVISGAQVHSLPIEPTVVQRLSAMLEAGHQPGEAEVVSLMQQTYRDFVRLNTLRFAELFGHLLASDAPLVFHCTAGKDRTGFAAALILHALGVPREVILHDYLLTNELLKPGRGSHTVPPDIAAVLFRVQEPFLAAALHAVDEDHGSLDNYLSSALGMGSAQREQLAGMYLQAA